MFNNWVSMWIFRVARSGQTCDRCLSLRLTQHLDLQEHFALWRRRSIGSLLTRNKFNRLRTPLQWSCIATKQLAMSHHCTHWPGVFPLLSISPELFRAFDGLPDGQQHCTHRATMSTTNAMIMQTTKPRKRTTAARYTNTDNTQTIRAMMQPIRVRTQITKKIISRMMDTATHARESRSSTKPRHAHAPAAITDSSKKGNGWS